ncbi:MAG TPA: serine hydrolase domain-containing protein [Acidimicrobiales bacterium]|nr:serine hydrolase domain-containing protein [Acidimicrobiales bacterium]
MVRGTCDPAFGAVRDAFAANFEAGEVGAACCVSVEGRVVVDIWGGWARTEPRREWAHDTLVNAYSVGKPVIALRLLQLVERGLVDLDDRADGCWPELRAGQQGATVRDLLCHRAGVPAIRAPLSDDALGDWHAMCDAIAATDPWWEPGTRHAYHTNTYGHLVGEAARRLDGRLPGTWLRDDIAGPLGADLAWGLSAAERARCADVSWEIDVAGAVELMTERARSAETAEQRMIALGYANPPGYSGMGVVNSDAWRAAQVPSTNLHATARGVARLYTALAAGGALDGVTVLGPALLAEATSAQSVGWCPVLEREATFGLGFQPTRPDRPFGPNPGSFGHFGTGGALGFADPHAGVGFGYVMNSVRPRWQSPRNRALVDALYGCL